MSIQRPKDCPPGLWEVLSGLLQDPAEFLADDPEVYQEIRDGWNGLPRKPPKAEVSSQSGPPGRKEEPSAESVRATAYRIPASLPSSLLSEVRALLIDAAASIEQGDWFSTARSLHWTTSALLDALPENEPFTRTGVDDIERRQETG